ncbi:MAG TPA: gluconokinase [Terriglobales bacterium]
MLSSWSKPGYRWDFNRTGARMVLVMMGVVGAGKTTVGMLLAQKLGWQFADADDFHSRENVDKIRHGIALTDADRAPWLAALRQAIAAWSASGTNAVLACSALKQAYRDELGSEGVVFVYLQGSYQLIRQRLHSRHGHFATESILKSQLEDLQEPNDAITVEVDKSPEAIVAEIIDKLKSRHLAYPDAAQNDHGTPPERDSRF